MIYIKGDYDFGLYLHCDEHGTLPALPADPQGRMTVAELARIELLHRMTERHVSDSPDMAPHS